MRKLTLLGILVLLLSACGKHTYQYYHSFGDHTWNYQDSVSFPINVGTPGIYAFSILIRNDDAYPYSNIWTYANIKYPDGSIKKERFNLTLADVTGRWLGQGPGEIVDNRYLVIPQMEIPAAGTYTITLRHDMRKDALNGVREVGVRLAQVGYPK